MSRYVDMTNQRFGKLTVLERDFLYKKEHNLKNSATYWKCKCDCGNIISVSRANLLRGTTTNCGCVKRKGNPKDLTGQTFGRLTVLEEDKEYYNNHQLKTKRIIWKCRCECGNIISVARSKLTCGEVKSCGCLAKDTKSNKEYLEHKYGLLTPIKIVGVDNFRNNLILCKCDCGNYIKKSTAALRVSGKFASCGCVFSQGEAYIKKLLQDNNIIYEEQKTYPNCKFPNTGGAARFDFYINNSFLLEYDGQQHYKYTNQGWNTKETYEKTIYKDNYKNLWCKENNILLKRIPYWELDNLTIEDILSDKFLITENKK